jgi:hypothetical protein
MIMKKSLLALSCMAVLIAAATPSLNAATISGASYLVTTNSSTVPPIGSAFYSGTPDTTFTITGTAGLIGFHDTSSSATLAQFLATDPSDTVTWLTGNGGASPLLEPTTGCSETTCTQETVIRFTGTVDLTAGQTYSISHDDGVLLYLGASNTPVINAGGISYPTFPVNSSFVATTSGDTTFTLDYMECCGAPATLTTLTFNPINAPIVPTPEPSSFILFGSGLLAAAGAVRRRMTA